MSREIKFRAWNMPFGSDGLMQRMTHGRAGDILSFAEMDPDNYIVEQFTGLNDKNGKDIYEGDILENPKYRSVVKFCAGGFYVDVIGAVNHFPVAGEISRNRKH